MRRNWFWNTLVVALLLSAAISDYAYAQHGMPKGAVLTKPQSKGCLLYTSDAADEN